MPDLRALSLAFAVSLVSVACASSPPPAKVVAAKPAPKKIVQRITAPPGHASRANVERALSAGPPWLIQRVLHDAALTKDGKFTGWRITGLPEEWSDIDIRPGDVVTRVNDRPLETPDEAWEAWKSIGRAREVRVRLERDGISREVVVPIDGEPSAAIVRMLESDTPPPRPATSGRPRTVTTLGSDTPPGEDPNGWESY